MIDKCLLGWLIMILIMAVVIGPLIVFSNIGGFVSPNHVTGGLVRMTFVVNHNFTINELARIDP